MRSLQTGSVGHYPHESSSLADGRIGVVDGDAVNTCTAGVGRLVACDGDGDAVPVVPVVFTDSMVAAGVASNVRPAVSVTVTVFSAPRATVSALKTPVPLTFRVTVALADRST